MTPILQICVVIITSALLQTVTSANFNDTIFAVTTSSEVTGGKEELVCAQIHGPTEPVTLTVSLKMRSGTGVILEEAVNQDFYRCINYRFPVVTSSTAVSITVKVQGQSGGMTASTKILIQPENFVHIVQTDKPIYKPGQTVNFRIVSLDTNFIPVNRVTAWV